jgi:hypothetical protein
LILLLAGLFWLHRMPCGAAAPAAELQAEHERARVLLESHTESQ